MSISIEEYRRKYADQSAELKISVISPVCTGCANFDASNPVTRQCRAFPDGIPLEIWKGQNITDLPIRATTEFVLKQSKRNEPRKAFKINS